MAGKASEGRDIREAPELVLTLVKCTNCEYEWWTKSVLKYITCPSCGRKTPREGMTFKVR